MSDITLQPGKYQVEATRIHQLPSTMVVNHQLTVLAVVSATGLGRDGFGLVMVTARKVQDDPVVTVPREGFSGGS